MQEPDLSSFYLSVAPVCRVRDQDEGEENEQPHGQHEESHRVLSEKGVSVLTREEYGRTWKENKVLRKGEIFLVSISVE